MELLVAVTRELEEEVLVEKLGPEADRSWIVDEALRCFVSVRPF